MAVKTYCDKCNVEIRQDEEFATITNFEKQFTLKDPNPQVMQVTRLACGKCFKLIKKIFENGKKL